MDNLWITTDKLALIKGVSTRAIRKAIALGKISKPLKELLFE